MKRRAIAWTLFVGSVVGFVLSAFRVIGASEPLLVLLLSWGALVYESANSIFVTHPEPAR